MPIWMSSQVSFRDLSGVLLFKDSVQLGFLTRTGMEPQNHLSSLKHRAETSAATTGLPWVPSVAESARRGVIRKCYLSAVSDSSVLYFGVGS